MQVITNGLPLSEAEKDQYVRYIRENTRADGIISRQNAQLLYEKLTSLEDEANISELMHLTY